MLDINTFTCNMLSENCYVVNDETLECVIIDCGAFYPEECQTIVDYIEKRHLQPKHLLCTHGHFDHCMGNGLITSKFGLRPEVHGDDEFLMEKMASQTREIVGVELQMDVPPVGRYLKGGDKISFGNHTLDVLHTPGHTPGGVVYYCDEEHVAFSGDTLFRMNIGRTDFERSSFEQMLNSLKTVMAGLPDNTIVYPGHGPATKIGEEKRYNPYMR